MAEIFRRCPLCGRFMEPYMVKDYLSWHREYRCICGYDTENDPKLKKKYTYTTKTDDE